MHNHIITAAMFEDAKAKWPNDAAGLDALKILLKYNKLFPPEKIMGIFGNKLDVFKVESGRQVHCFDVGGNNLRVITAIHHSKQHSTIYVLEIMTHAEYSKHTWKKRY